MILNKIKVGDEVYWNDPDNGYSSGIYTIQEIEHADMIKLVCDGSEAEVFLHELRPIELSDLV